MGHATRLKFKAQMGLGTSMPYINPPPLDSCPGTGKNQGI